MAEFSNVLYGVEDFWDTDVSDGEPTGVGGGMIIKKERRIGVVVNSPFVGRVFRKRCER